jgi:hypothetical protein
VAGKKPVVFGGASGELGTVSSGRLASDADNRRSDSKSSNRVMHGGFRSNAECPDVAHNEEDTAVKVIDSSTVPSETIPDRLNMMTEENEDGITSSAPSMVAVASPLQNPSADMLSTKSRISYSASESTPQRSLTHCRDGATAFMSNPDAVAGGGDGRMHGDSRPNWRVRAGDVDNTPSQELEMLSKNLGLSISPGPRAEGRRSYRLGTSTSSVVKQSHQFNQSPPFLTASRSTSHNIIVISSDSDDVTEPSTKRGRTM